MRDETSKKTFDAADVAIGDLQTLDTQEIRMLPVDEIQPFRDHPFRLYEGDRLEKMVESIRENGILNPVIVRKLDTGYEMLSGHNRLNAAKIAGLKEIQAIIKTGLSEEEAYVYVIETNLVQRSFAKLLPSEMAVVLSRKYAWIAGQGRRNDIRREIEIMHGRKPSEISGQAAYKKSLDSLSEEYGMSGRNIARYMKINKLIDPLKKLVDRKKIGLVVVVDLSYLKENEQEMLAEQIQRDDLKITPEQAIILRDHAGSLTEERLNEILHPEGCLQGNGLTVKIPADVEERYFSGLKAKDRAQLIMQALDAWFAGKEVRDE